jgi:hypothetical protein
MEGRNGKRQGESVWKIRNINLITFCVLHDIKIDSFCFYFCVVNYTPIKYKLTLKGFLGFSVSVSVG